MGQGFYTPLGMPGFTDGPPKRLNDSKASSGAQTPRTHRKAVALVLSDKCAGCGICVDVCPTHAIRIERQAIIDPSLCRACSVCVAECPNEAIIITQQSVS